MLDRRQVKLIRASGAGLRGAMDPTTSSVTRVGVSRRWGLVPIGPGVGGEPEHQIGRGSDRIWSRQIYRAGARLSPCPGKVLVDGGWVTIYITLKFAFLVLRLYSEDAYGESTALYNSSSLWETHMQEEPNSIVRDPASIL